MDDTRVREERINKLLKELAKIADKLNKVNDEISQLDYDLEDMIPGHDEGVALYSKLEQYKILVAQANRVKKELKELGYKKVR